MHFWGRKRLEKSDYGCDIQKIVEDIDWREIQWVVLERNEGFIIRVTKNQREWMSAKTDEHKLYFQTGTAQKRMVILAQTRNAGTWGVILEDDRYLVISAANSTYGMNCTLKI
jgi:prolyl oligopeptidase